MVATICSAVHAAPSGGQILGGQRPTAKTPPNWFGAGVAIVQPFSLQDGTTSSNWNFDSSIGYMASFEHPTKAGIMVGVPGTYARPTMVFTGNVTPGLGTTCTGGCDAHGTVTQIEGLVHSGNSYSFHQVYQLTIGATGFSNFKTTAGERVGPASTDYDFSFSIGYGLGFGVSSNFAIEALQQIGTVLHQRDGLAAGSGNYPTISVTRLGGKFSF
jgi:hypothetical protein